MAASISMVLECVIARKLAVALLASLMTVAAPEPVRYPAAPPRHEAPDLTGRDPVVKVHVEYDEHLVAQHGENVEQFIRDAVMRHATEWRRYRREWFDVERLTFRPSGSERDASYVLAAFQRRSPEAPGTIHVRLVGRPLEVYTSAVRPVTVAGVAYRGSDTVVISATRGVSAELAGYYLFHEIGHCWGAHDLPFGGGDSTFGSKSRYTFDIDAGNAEIIHDSGGPKPRTAPARAPLMIEGKLGEAEALGLDAATNARLSDLLLHEPSPANPAYQRKKRQLLASRPRGEAAAIASLLKPYEITRRQARQDGDLRARIAEHYWRANDALARHDYLTAELELAAIRAADASSPDVHLLVGAVERKIRRRR